MSIIKGLDHLIKFDHEVIHAIQDHKAIVTLESNVITHGLPYPDNLQTALAVEAAVRESGAIPATIALINGYIQIGLTESMKYQLATEANIPKVGSREMAMVLSEKILGATTVSSSLIATEMAGLPIFSSAGLGGVHRGAEKSMDISSDLIQLTRSKVAVVCAGAKKILDLPKTCEYLETQCVPVIGFGSNKFPAFYCIDSGMETPQWTQSVSAIARAMVMHWQHLGQSNGILITCPTREEDAIDHALVEDIINQAQREVENYNIHGNQITKHIMRKIDSMTNGKTSQANKAVLINTARQAGTVAVAYQKLKQEQE